MTASLHQLHQFSQRMIERLRQEIPARGLIPISLARDLALAEQIPVVLGYLRSVRTGDGMKLTTLMIADAILAADTNFPAGEASASPERRHLLPILEGGTESLPAESEAAGRGESLTEDAL